MSDSALARSLFVHQHQLDCNAAATESVHDAMRRKLECDMRRIRSLERL